MGPKVDVGIERMQEKEEEEKPLPGEARSQREDSGLRPEQGGVGGVRNNFERDENRNENGPAKRRDQNGQQRANRQRNPVQKPELRTQKPAHHLGFRQRRTGATHEQKAAVEKS